MEPTDNRVCALTYVNEKDLPEGKKLIPCWTCQETFYVSLDAMKEHHEVHRQVCCALHEDRFVQNKISCGGFNSVEDALYVVRWILEDPDRWLQGRLLLYAFQQALSFLKNRPGGTEFDEDMILAHVFVILRIGELSLESTKIMWAIPGFANYFLGPSVWNPPEVTGLPDGEVLSAGGDQSDHGQKLGPQQLNGLYCAMLTLILKMPIFGANRQNTRLQACVHRHFFQMWSDRQFSTSWPETFFSFGDTVATRMDDFWSILSKCCKLKAPLLEHSLMIPNELVPGLTVKELFVLLMEDQTMFESPTQEELDDDCVCLLDLLHEGTLALSYFTTEECIGLFNIAEKWNPPDRHVRISGIFPEQKSLTLFDFVLYLLTFQQTKRVIDLKHNCLTESSLAHAVVDHYYQGLMGETMPPLRDFLEAFNNHQRKLISHDQQPIEVPEDVAQHIAEFLFPDNIPVEMLYIHDETVPAE